MDLIIYMAIFMLFVGGFFLGLFVLAVKTGQFRDLKTPAHKILLDEEDINKDDNKDTKTDKEKSKEDSTT